MPLSVDFGWDLGGGVGTGDVWNNRGQSGLLDSLTDIAGLIARRDANLRRQSDPDWQPDDDWLDTVGGLGDPVPVTVTEDGGYINAATGQPVNRRDVEEMPGQYIPIVPTFPVPSDAGGGPPNRSGGGEGASTGPNPVWDPANRQFGLGDWRNVLGLGAIYGPSQGGAQDDSQSQEPPMARTPASPREGGLGDAPRYNFGGGGSGAVGTGGDGSGDGSGGNGGNGGDGMEGEFNYEKWDELFGEGPGEGADPKQWKDYLWDIVGTFTDPRLVNTLLDAEGTYAPQWLGQRSDNIAEASSGYLPTAQNSIAGISEADIGADAAARSSGADFFGDDYGGLLEGLKGSNKDLYEMLDSQQGNAMSLSNAASGLIENAGQLNDRQRNDVLQMSLGHSVATGRDRDPFAVADMSTNLIESQDAKRDRDYGMGMALNRAAGDTAALRHSVEQPYVQDVFGLNQDPYAGLTAAEASRNLGSNVGPSMFDVGSLYGIATGDRNLAANQQAAQYERDSQSRLNRLQLGLGVAELFDLDERAYDLLGLGGEG